MSLIMTFMFEPAKLQMNWASASGTSILRNDARMVCPSPGSVMTATRRGLGRPRRDWPRSGFVPYLT
jgi:hypothetical protein